MSNSRSVMRSCPRRSRSAIQPRRRSGSAPDNGTPLSLRPKGHEIPRFVPDQGHVVAAPTNQEPSVTCLGKAVFSPVYRDGDDRVVTDSDLSYPVTAHAVSNPCRFMDAVLRGLVQTAPHDLALVSYRTPHEAYTDYITTHDAA